jgi:hypothetical protein
MASTEENTPLEWPSQSPDLNLIEMLWHDLKRAVHIKNPKNIAELKQFCEEEWSKFLLSIEKTFGCSYCCQRMVNQLLNPRVQILFSPCTVNV